MTNTIMTILASLAVVATMNNNNIIANVNDDEIHEAISAELDEMADDIDIIKNDNGMTYIWTIDDITVTITEK